MDGRRIKARRQRGVTLLELLVVVAILALVTSVAVFSAPPPQSSARAEAERFAARLGAAVEDAILTGVVMSAEVTPAGYRILRYDGGAWRADDGRGRFAERKFARNVRVTLTLEDAALANRVMTERNETGRKEEEEPQRIIIDPVGLTSPFTAEFSARRETWIVRGDAGGAVEVEPND